MQKRMMDYITRRDILKLGGMAVAGTLLDQTVWPLKVKAAGKAQPRSTARNAIMIQICGAISPWDTWDFKEQARQPKDLDVRKTASGVYLSKTLFPLLSDHTDKVSFVRSMRSSELVHFNGQYHTQAGRAMSPAIAKEVPAFGSVIAYELESRRHESDTFPTYCSLNTGPSEPGSIGPGFLPARFGGFDLFAEKAFETFGGNSGGVAEDVLARRWDVLSSTAETLQGERTSFGDKEVEYRSYYHDAYKIMSDPRWPKVFQVSDEDRKRYGSDSGGYASALMLARNMLAADAGTHFLYIDEVRTWDQHTKIFDRKARENHYLNCLRWDKGYVALLTDLASLPGHEPGKSLLDETLVVAGSEFGRTPEINPLYGRHHYRDAYSFIFAGGGIKPGRIVGVTNSAGKVSDTGWKHKEQPFMDNAVATIYSALGIDWLKTVENTPSGRAYHYTQTAPLGASEFQSDDAIDELFV